MSMDILEWTYYGNALRTWGFALLVTATLFLSLRAIHMITLRQLRRYRARHAEGAVDDGLATTGLAVVERTRPFFLLIIAAFLATRLLYIPAELASVVRGVVVLALVVQAGLWGSAAIGRLLERIAARRGESDPAAATTLGFLGFLARFALWSVLVLLALRNAFEMDVSALLAGLGIGGIAIALAVQEVLGDLFASLSIVLDKPFVLGDFIVVGDVSGTVEHIGLKTTRVRSLFGEQIVFSNASLLESRVHNYKHLNERCIIFNFSVPFATPPERVAAIPAVVEGAVERQENTRFGRAHLANLGESALEFEVLYFVLDPSYDLYMDIQQAINLDLLRRFAEMGVEFALPIRTVDVRQGVATQGETVDAGV